LLERAEVAHLQAKRRAQSPAKNDEGFSWLDFFFESKWLSFLKKLEPCRMPYCKKTKGEYKMVSERILYSGCGPMAAREKIGCS
jgi:hypothetical protein